MGADDPKRKLGWRIKRNAKGPLGCPESGQDFLNLRHVRSRLSVHGTVTRRTPPDRTTKAFRRTYVPCRVAILMEMATFLPQCRRYCGTRQWHRTNPFLLNRLA